MLARRESSPKSRGETGVLEGTFMAVACFLGLRTSPFENFSLLREASGDGGVIGIREVAASEGAGAGEEADLVLEEGTAGG